ncbi:MAG: right-handed parallel beta-helix repeat-containing protein [bacterium]|nr:right-handed parallel beta-helix repeat-containing protein [bacterium]
MKQRYFFIIVAVAFLILTWIRDSFATVYINRTLTSPQCDYSLGIYDIYTTETWDVNYQNAYGGCTNLMPGSPFILERSVIVHPGATLNIINVTVSSEVIIQVQEGGTLNIISSTVSPFMQITVFGELNAMQSTFTTSSNQPFHFQGEWNVTFDECVFNLSDAAVPAIRGFRLNLQNQPTTLFQNCTFSYTGTPVTLMSVDGASLSIVGCTFDNVAGTGIIVNSVDEFTLISNEFVNVQGEPVQILGAGIRTIAENHGSNNFLNAIVLGHNANKTSAADTGLAILSSHSTFPFVIRGELNVPPLATLEISDSSILKFSIGGEITVNGILNAQSAVMTSNNSSLGGVTGGNGNPQPGDWTGISVVGLTTVSSPRARANLFNCQILYGRGSGLPSGSLRQGVKSTVFLDSCTIAYSYSDGAFIAGGSSSDTSGRSAVIQHCVFHNNQHAGVEVRGNSKDSVLIQQNTIVENENGVVVWGSSVAPVIYRNRISGNRSNGVLIQGTANSPFVVNNLIYANRLDGFSHNGGGVNDFRIINNHFYGNGRDGVRLRGTSNSNQYPQLSNNIISENMGFGVNEIAANTNSVPRNNDFFNNTAGIFRRNAGTILTLEEVNLLPNAENNIAEDPLFNIILEGMITALSYDTTTNSSVLTDVNASFFGVKGLVVYPDISLIEQFLILDYTNNTLTVAGDIRNVSMVGNSYKIVADFPVDEASPVIDAGENRSDLPPFDFNGNVRISFGSSSMTVDIGAYEFAPPSNTELSQEVPTKVSLEANYPNPFNPTTTIRYSIPQNNIVTLTVYDILGSEVATLVNEEQSAGSYEVSFNASHLSSGIYVYRLRSGSFVETKKMVLLK